MGAIEFETAEWGRAQIDSIDLELLAELTGLSEADCLDRLRSHRLEDVAAAWREADPQSPAEILDFYRRTDLYLWDLLTWNGSSDYAAHLRELDRLTELWPAPDHPRALDYGCGVGTAALRLAERGYAVTLADVPGLTLAYARERLARHGHEVDVLEITEDRPALPERAWDVLVCLDVLEHVAYPAELTRSLTKALVRGGGAAISFDNSDDPQFPQHLPQARTRFGGDRWARFLLGLGMAPVEGFCHRRTGRVEEWARALRYRLWRVTGIYLTRARR